MYDNTAPLGTFIFLLLAAPTIFAQEIERHSVSIPATPTVELLRESGDTSDSDESDTAVARYSITLNCNNCQISQVSLNLEVDSADLETVGLFYVSGNDRTRIITLGSADISSDTQIPNSLDFDISGGACFTITTTYLNGSSETSQESCFTIT